MDQCLSLITLDAADLGRAVDFYGRLRWESGNDPEVQGVAFFQCGGIVVGLWDRDELAGDRAVAGSGGWGGVTLAYNVGSPAEVDATLAEAKAAGAEIGRPDAPTDWGGYSGLFRDPDGDPWEVAHNPFWTIAEDGSITI